MSSIKCVRLEAKTSIEPFAVGTIAMLDVMAPSIAFNVETTGRPWPSGHRVMKPSDAGGTTVVLNTYACATLEGVQALLATSIVC